MKNTIGYLYTGKRIIRLDNVALHQYSLNENCTICAKPGCEELFIANETDLWLGDNCCTARAYWGMQGEGEWFYEHFNLSALFDRIENAPDYICEVYTLCVVPGFEHLVTEEKCQN